MIETFTESCIFLVLVNENVLRVDDFQKMGLIVLNMRMKCLKIIEKLRYRDRFRKYISLIKYQVTLVSFGARTS